MLIKSRSRKDVRSSEITSESLWLSRRQLMRAGGAALASTVLPLSSPLAGAAPTLTGANTPPWLAQMLSQISATDHKVDEALTPEDIVTSYNNFYEFGTDKTDPRANAQGLKVSPWNVLVTGEVRKAGEYHLEDLIKPHHLEERVYRFRCVEAWSMVVPWVGIPLASVLRQFEPTANARYVRFETLYDPVQMPGQASLFASIDYPYVEGLRIDEAMHDLAFLAVGLYGKALPPQNGAPLRLVVPWKYGFKSIKSIVKIELTEKQPRTTWEKANSREYGFYANVNPSVDHPRWSQARERRLPNSLFSPRYTDTRLFNGYADEVAQLYSGMNLSRFY
ncbi:MAG: protein-methionine-sulfoxide reductase catalytic subunit MsrP [Gammaproteobacteria bacterium]|nr:protein-methionine-sulfoxide reductase catalytic subunit MsrP [Gammaproteobacteria bacterium]